MSIQKLLFLLFILATILSCGSTKEVAQKPVQSSSSKGKKELSEEELINLKFLFVNANKEKILGNQSKAEEYFAQCIRIDGTHHASMFELAKIYLEQKKINDAIFFARS